jgi:hypothetical protein
LSKSVTPFTKYISRSDIKETFEDNVLNLLGNGDLILLGSPGVGKSASSKAIAAKYNGPNHPAIVLSIGRGRDRFESRIEVMKIDDKLVPITIVVAPFASTEGAVLLKNIIYSLTRLQQQLSSLSRMMKEWRNNLENVSLVKNIEKHLTSIVPEIPKGIENLSEFATILTEMAPYVSSA